MDNNSINSIQQGNQRLNHVDVSAQRNSGPSNQKQQSRRTSTQINPIALLRQPQLFKSTFFEFCCQASDAIKSHNFEQSAKLLQSCVQMLDVGRNPLKDISIFWKACVYGNLACSYQGQWKVKKSHKYCDQMEQQMQKIRDKYRNQQFLNQKHEQFVNRQNQQNINYLRKNRQIYLKISMQLVKLKFQHCALISQLNQHQKALQNCKSTLKLLEQIIIIVLTYTKQVKYKCNSKGKEEINADKILREKQGQQSRFDRPVEFAQMVSQYAQTVLTQLEKILKESLEYCQKQISQDNLRIHQNHFYYWQKNPEKNEQQIKKKFIPTQNTSGKRSILGVNKNKHWIDDFNIGGIMHMNEITLSEFENPPPIEEYLFKDKIYQLIILCSVAHFTIATQQRFIDSNRKKQKRNEQKRKEQQKKQKYRRLIQQSKQKQRKQAVTFPDQANLSRDGSQKQASYISLSVAPLKQSSSLISAEQISDNEKLMKKNISSDLTLSNQQKKKISLQKQIICHVQEVMEQKEQFTGNSSQVVQIIQKKYGYQQKSQIFKESELYHLRSIDIIAKNIQFTIPYLSHLIQSYQKHYINKKNLQPITAIVEESALSVDITARQNSVSLGGLTFGAKIVNQLGKKLANSFQNYGNACDSQYGGPQEKKYSQGLHKHNFVNLKPFDQKTSKQSLNQIYHNPFEGSKNTPLKIPSQGDLQEIQIYYETNEQVNGLKPKNLHLQKHRIVMKGIKQIKKNTENKKKKTQQQFKEQARLHKIKSERKMIALKDIQKSKQSTNIYTKKQVKELNDHQKTGKNRKKSVEKTRTKNYRLTTAQFAPCDINSLKIKGKDSNHQNFIIFSRQKSPKQVFKGNFNQALNNKFYFEERAKSPKSKSIKKGKISSKSQVNEIDYFQKNVESERQKDLKFHHNSHTHIKVIFKKKK